MRIACFNVQPTEEVILNQLSQAGRSVSLHPFSLTPANAADFADVEILNLMSYQSMGESLFSLLPNLKCISVRATGFNQFDVEYLQRRGIPLLNVRQYCDAAVAEHALCLLLMLSRRVKAYFSNSQEGKLVRDPSMMGFDWQGKTLGIWGAGSTAAHLIPIAKAMGMRVLVHNRRPKPDLAAATGCEFVSWDALLAESDALCAMVAVTPETEGRLNAAAFAAMKPTAFVINVARGVLVQSGDLLDALNTGQIAGAGLDVLPDEPTFFAPKRFWNTVLDASQALATQQLYLQQLLMQHPKVVHTPHVAFYSEEAVVRMTQQSVENIEQFVAKVPFTRCVFD